MIRLALQLPDAVWVFSAASAAGHPGGLAEVCALDIRIGGIHRFLLLEAVFVRSIALVGGRHLAGHSGFLLRIDLASWQCRFPDAFRRHFGILLEDLSLARRHRPAVSRSAPRLAALTARLGSKFAILREAPPLGWDAFASLAPGLGRELRVLREAPFFGRDALAAFARYGALLRLIHRSKAAIGRPFVLVIPRHDVSFLKSAGGGLSARRYR